MTTQFNVDLLEKYIAPSISKFYTVEIPDLRQVHDQHLYWLSNHFLNSSLSGAYVSPMRQYAINAIYRIQSAFKDYHEARDLTYNYLKVTLPDNPAINMWLFVKDPSKNDENIDRIASIEQVRSKQNTFDFPLIVLTRATDSDELSKIETDLQVEFLKLSAKSKQYFSKHNDHFIQNSEPELVIDSIRQVVESVKANVV